MKKKNVSYCFTEWYYKRSAANLAYALGDNDDSNPYVVCRYSNQTSNNIDRTCEADCMTLINNVLGECYCTDPKYKPETGNNYIKNFSTMQLFQLIGTTDYAKSANCRDVLKTPENKNRWLCRG